MRFCFVFKRVVVILILCISLFLCNYYWKRTKFEKTKYILYWNSAYGSSEYGFCCGRKPYIKYNCQPKRNCFVTNDRNYLPSISDFDAILFHQRTLSKHDLPRERAPHQRYIFYLLESPSNQLYLETATWNTFFNWSMTYRLDSDFPIIHGKLRAKSNSNSLSIDGTAKRLFGENNAQKYSKGKNKLVAWFVSNCVTPSQRELLVNILRKYGIKVDIYGACGKHQCHKIKEASCWKKIESEYKFYLSLENSICKDYTTEKLWNALNHTIIPIVLGGGDYPSFLPEGSYIDANQNPKALSSIIKELNKDDAKYAEYFWWKDRFSASVLSDEEHAERHCNLCDRLHKDNSVQVIEDLEKWWEKEAKCSKFRL